MEPYRHHVYVCDQRKPEGAPCCSANGSARVIEALRRELDAQGMVDEVQVTTCGSLGLCERGPNMVVYPGGVWYSGVRPGDVAEIVREHLGGGRVVERLALGDPGSLRAEISEARAKMASALGARDEAGALPDDLQATIRAFQESRVVLTAVELDVFTAVGAGADAASVARAAGTDPRATETLLNALVALELLEKRAGVFFNGPVSARFLVAGAPHDSRAALRHTLHLWSSWSTLTDCVRAGTSVTYRDMSEAAPEWTSAFIAAMHRNASSRAPMVVRAAGVEGVRRVLDLGGGSGAYAIGFAQASPTLRAVVFDLPNVIPITRQHVEAAGLADRVTTAPGDLRVDRYGSGFDLAFVSAICHMNSPDENLEMLGKILDALEPGGRVVIQDFILRPDKTSPRTGALFALNMLVGTRAGSSYGEDEYAAWLAQAGFVDARRVDLPGPTALMVARKPG
jgi:(2Fe-2S) ferredoxin/predicted O-methyltransferase YrrM